MMDAFAAVALLALMSIAAVAAGDPSRGWWEARLLAAIFDAGGCLQYLATCMVTSWAAAAHAAQHQRGAVTFAAATDRGLLLEFLLRRRRLSSFMLWMRGLDMDDVVAKLGGRLAPTPGPAGEGDSGDGADEGEGRRTGMWGWGLVLVAWLLALIPALPAVVMSVSCAFGGLVLALRDVRRAPNRSVLFRWVLAAQVLAVQF